MVRRRRQTKSESKQSEVVAGVDPHHLTKDGILVLQRYVEHGMRLPPVSLKTSYKDIWKHTKKFHCTTRRALAALAGRIQTEARRAPDTFSNSALCAFPNDEAIQAFLSAQSCSVRDLLSDSARVVEECRKFGEDSEADLARLKDEVERLKVATAAQERRELLLELTHAVPAILCMNDVMDRTTNTLKDIQKELDDLEQSSEICFGPILPLWKLISLSGIHLLL